MLSSEDFLPCQDRALHLASLQFIRDLHGADLLHAWDGNFHVH